MHAGSGSFRCLGAEYFHNDDKFESNKHSTPPPEHGFNEARWPSFLVEGRDRRLMLIKLDLNNQKYRLEYTVSNLVPESINSYAPSTPKNGFFVFGLRGEVFPWATGDG